MVLSKNSSKERLDSKKTKEKQDESEESEEDFMSDKFIQKSNLINNNNKHHQTYSEKRKRKLIKVSNNQHKKNRAEREIEAREEGLNRNLINTNSNLNQSESHSKAVQIMIKMGFQPGTSLGLNQSGTKNLNNNPIHIVPKSDKLGIGIKFKKSNFNFKKIPKLLFGEEINLDEEEIKKMDNFLELSKSKFDNKKVKGILSRACRTCEELDRRSGLEFNIFWISSHSQEDINSIKKLDQLINQDQNLNDDNLNDSIEINNNSKQEEEEKNWLALEPSIRLVYTLGYLRQEYFYCIWCGCQFESFEELEKECPGEEEEDH